MGGHGDMGTSVHLEMASKNETKKDLVIAKLYYALKRITRYQSPARLRRDSQKQWGLPYDEAMEYSYENIQQEAKNALKGVKLPKPKENNV